MSSFAGSFLVASPNLKTPTFARTVVLLLRHDTDGAFGLVVNRPTTRTVQPFPVYAGGPCQAQGLLLLHGHADWGDGQKAAKEVAPGIFVGDFAALKRVSEGAAAGYRFRAFIGYACWDKGQLEQELALSVWTITPADGEWLFDIETAHLWESLAMPGVPRPSAN